MQLKYSVQGTIYFICAVYFSLIMLPMKHERCQLVDETSNVCKMKNIPHLPRFYWQNMMGKMSNKAQILGKLF